MESSACEALAAFARLENLPKTHMESVSPTISPRPSLGAWLVGLGSLLVVTVFVLAVLVMGKALREQALYDRVAEHLKFREYSQAEELTEQMASPPLALRAVRLIAPADAVEAHQHGIQVAKVILSVTSALSVNRIDEAQRRLLLFPSGSSEPMIQRTQEGLSALTETAKKLETQQQLLTLSEQALNAASQQGALVADEFGELLGLPAIRVAADDAVLPAYERGVLSGLPRLSGLRDDIGDLSLLKVELEGLHAQVKASGTDAHETFTARLETMRTSYTQINAKFEEAVSQFEAAQDATIALGRESSTLKTKLQTDLGAAVLALLQPSAL